VRLSHACRILTDKTDPFDETKGGYINDALFTSPLTDLQSTFSYEMQKFRFGRRTRRTMTHAAFAASDFGSCVSMCLIRFISWLIASLKTGWFCRSSTFPV